MVMKGFCSVCCDILHEGHIRLFDFAKSRCDHLTVGVMSDESILLYKGKLPILSLQERMLIVSNQKQVDAVIVQNSFYEVNEIIRKNGIGVFIENSEHNRQVSSSCLKLTHPYFIGQSSSKIKDKVKKIWKKS